MKVSRGDVVLVDFPFAAGAGQKLRPAVVVQSDKYNRRLATTILAPVTSNIRHQHEQCQVPVDPTSPTGSQTGLLRPSSIKCENLATVETVLVRRKIGTVPMAILTQLESAIRDALGIA
jgi:mRNA interferase MazF